MTIDPTAVAAVRAVLEGRGPCSERRLRADLAAIDPRLADIDLGAALAAAGAAEVVGQGGAPLVALVAAGGARPSRASEPARTASTGRLAPRSLPVIEPARALMLLVVIVVALVLVLAAVNQGVRARPIAPYAPPVGARVH